MSYQEQLTTEIHKVLDDLAQKQSPWNATWIAHQICSDHSEGLNDSDHSHFWRHCGYEDCRDQVRRCINSRAGDRPDPNDAQLKLGGDWEHLQAYYIVKRGGDEVGVPVHEMTDTELAAKASTYRKMATACQAHADELDRFAKQRRPVRSAEPAMA